MPLDSYKNASASVPRMVITYYCQTLRDRHADTIGIENIPKHQNQQRGCPEVTSDALNRQIKPL